MLKLYQLERTWGIPNLSHFCCKTETYLRMAGIEYEIVPALPLNAPKGKVPYIEEGGSLLGDSGFIVQYLTPGIVIGTFGGATLAGALPSQLLSIIFVLFIRDFPIELNSYWKPLENHHDFIEV